MVLPWLRKAAENAIIMPAALLFLAVLWPVLEFWRTVGWFLYWPIASVKNRVVVITGASSGIGEYMAYEYAKRGAVLMLGARREEKLRAVAQRCKEIGAPDIAICRTDVSKEEDCKRIIDETVGRFGVLDVLVNNAGLARSGLFESYTDPGEFKSTVEVDFWGNVWTSVYALPHLRRSRGQIVVTASVAAYTTFPRQAFYNAAKAAIAQFYESIRVEAGRDVAVTIIFPGFVKSELTMGAPPDHIPRWWPMMGTQEAARQMVAQAVMRQRHVVVPAWYTAWLPYRILAPDYVDWVQRVLLLGQPPSAPVRVAVEAFCGKDVEHKVFGGLAATNAVTKGQ